MKREVWRRHSAALGRSVGVVRWGHYGRPVLLFPTAGGDALEIERFQLVDALAPLIDGGRIKLYSTDSVANDGWLSQTAAPAQKSALQARYDAMVASELCPFIREDCAGTPQRFVATGASIGAYNALNAGVRHPEWFETTIAMSGTYDFDRWMDGHRDQNYHDHMPLLSLADLPEGPRLDALRKRFFLLATGRGRYEAPWESDWIGALLAKKGIPHKVEKWGEDAHHDWPTWRTMLPIFLDRLA